MNLRVIAPALAALAGLATIALPVEAEPVAAASAAAGDCRTVVHELGEACVPNSPRRIVVLDPSTVLATLLEVGAPVVGSLSVSESENPLSSYLDPEQVADIELVGTLQAPSLEAIAAADPDLIIGAAPLVAPLQADLEAIAPTVATRDARYESGWRDDVRLVAKTVGASDVIEQRFAQLDEHIAEVRAGLEAQGGGRTLTRVDIMDGQPLYYRLGCTWLGEVLGAAGVSAPAAQGADECTDGDAESIAVHVAAEQLAVLDADAIVASRRQSPTDDVGPSPSEALEALPGWTALPAVQHGRVFVLGDAWGLGGSITSAHVVLTDLAEVVFPAS